MSTLFPKEQAVYFIFAPNWTHTSSGCRALHLLCHALNEKGQKAYIFPTEPGGVVNPMLDTPLATEVMAAWDPKLLSYDHIVVYPDVVSGNPLRARKVVRYLLAPAGLYGGDKTFAAADKIYGYTEDIHANVLSIPTFDPHIYYSSDQPRSGCCYYAHKYDVIHRNKLLPATDGMVRCEGTPTQVADILRRSEKCYLYERSEIAVNALLCGCPIEMIKTDYYDGFFPKEYIENGKLVGHHFEWRLRFENQLNAFIEDTQSWKN